MKVFAYYTVYQAGDVPLALLIYVQLRLMLKMVRSNS